MRENIRQGNKEMYVDQVSFHLIPKFEMTWKCRQHCRKKIGDVLIVSEQVQIICRSLGIRIAQFVGY